MNWTHRLGRALRAAWQLDWLERVAVLRVLCAAFAVEVGLRLLSLPNLACRIGVQLESGVDASPQAPRGLLRSEARLLRVAELVFRDWPFGGPCLRRSLVCGFFLRSRQPVLKIGVTRNGGSMTAHAWIEIDGAPVLENHAQRECYSVLQPAVRA